MTDKDTPPPQDSAEIEAKARFNRKLYHRNYMRGYMRDYRLRLKLKQQGKTPNV